MITKFKNHIDTNVSFLRKGKLLIACSGGLDSVVLAWLCHKLHLKYALAHCNFKLREEESDGDELFVRKLSNKLAVPFFVTHFDTEIYAKKHAISIQMSARELRYNWFQKILDEYAFDYLLTAHHQDDNLETFLINLSRGTGIKGLTGIPEINNTCIRPLLPFCRDQILKFAKENKIPWREDSSNSNTKYLRNKLRHEVIPQLTSINPTFLENFNRTIAHLKKTDQFINDQVKNLKKSIFEYSESEVIKISIKQLQEFESPKTYLFFLLKEYGFTAWDDILQIMTAQSGKQIFSATHRLVKDRTHLLLSPLIKETSEQYYSIPKEENMVMIPSGMLKFKEVSEMSTTNSNTIYVDKKMLKYPLTVRKWKKGDYFYPIGMKGKKKLSKYFKDEKLSLLAKEKVWLLCTKNDIVWVINYRADNRFGITQETEQIVKVTVTI